MKIVKPIVLNSFDFSRPSPATYYNSIGYLDDAGVDELRLGFNPTTLEFIGPIIEGEATNLIEYSEDFSVNETGKWEANGVTVNNDSLTNNPKGGTFAQYAVFTTSFSDLRYTPNPVTAGVYCVFSIYVRASGGAVSNTVVLAGNNGNGHIFNIAPGQPNEFLANGTFRQALPNNWYRIGIGGNAVSTPRIIAGNGAVVYVWGAQMEIGEQATSYIATDGATATRAADDTTQEKPRVVSTNVDENFADFWDPLRTYIAGETASVFGQYHRVYESIGTNTDKFPPDHSEEWIDQGATNPWRMFDMTVGPDKQTVSTESDNTVHVFLDFDTIANSVTLLNMEGNNVRVIMRDQFGETVYDHYEDLLQETPSSDWWSFFFATRSNIKTLVLTDLPSVRPSTIEMLLDGGAFPAKIGKMIVGEAVEIGCTRYGTSVGIVDFSRKERDAFGNNFILERRYIDRADFDIQIPTSTLDNVKALLTSARATPTLYIGDEDFASTVIYGFYKDFSIIISGPKKSDLTIQVESI